MIISLCGTPGTGKTTAASILARSGIRVVSLGTLIGELGVSEGADPASGSEIVDEESLRPALEEWARRVPGTTILEGHLSYLAPGDLCLLLRLDPNEILRRLRARGYPEAKCRENAEAEGVGTLLSWAVEEESRRMDGLSWEDLPPERGIVLEKDVTGMDPDAVAGWARAMLESYLRKGLNSLRPYRPGNVDWIEVLSGWY